MSDAMDGRRVRRILPSTLQNCKYNIGEFAGSWAAIQQLLDAGEQVACYLRVIDRRVKPDPFDINIFFLGVYARRDGRWQMAAWQSTRDVKLSPLQ